MNAVLYFSSCSDHAYLYIHPEIIHELNSPTVNMAITVTVAEDMLTHTH